MAQNKTLKTITSICFSINHVHYILFNTFSLIRNLELYDLQPKKKKKKEELKIDIRTLNVYYVPRNNKVVSNVQGQ